MSLVNEALKRAKAAQKSAEPPSVTGPALRPADPHPGTRLGIGIMVPAIFALLALIGLFWIWRNAQTAIPTAASARTPEPTSALAPTHPVADPSSDKIARASVKSDTATVPGGAEVLSGTTLKEPASGGIGSQAETSSANVATVPPARPTPPPLKLQAIFYEPSQPSAMIRGKTVMVGDTVEKMRVAAITDTSVTLIGEGRTNILTLP